MHNTAYYRRCGVNNKFNQVNISVSHPCEELGRHIGSYDEYMQKLGKSLGTTVNHYNHAYKELNKIDKDVTRITKNSIGIEPDVVDKPTLDE